MNKTPEQLRKEAAEIKRQGEAGGKDPSRVAAGKEAAATRKERYGTAAPGFSKPEKKQREDRKR